MNEIRLFKFTIKPIREKPKTDLFPYCHPHRQEGWLSSKHGVRPHCTCISAQFNIYVYMTQAQVENTSKSQH